MIDRLTFCSNILPGTDFQSHFSNLQTHLPEIRKACPWLESLGLRMGEAMALNFNSDHSLIEAMNRFLNDQGLKISTLNVFPQGEFHAAKVKDKVYLPDWSSPARRAYTEAAALAVSQLETPQVVSMSTVPLGYKRHHPKVLPETVFENLMAVVDHLTDLEAESGKCIRLALEPEPDCLLETTSETVDFFDQLRGRAKGSQLDRVERYLGLCFDTCHFAVNFEDPAVALQRLQEARVSVFKYQITSALSWREPLSHEELLTLFDEVYLHQTRAAKRPSSVEPNDANLKNPLCWPDLPADPLELRSEGSDCEWRCHFHTPLFVDSYDKLSGTSAYAVAVLKQAAELGLEPDTDLEVETYTWSVLPKALKTQSVHDCISQELVWAKAKVQECFLQKPS